MYSLEVSHDCGISYHVESSREDPTAFEKRCKALDSQMLRWCIKSKDGEIVALCGIHKNIFATLKALNTDNNRLQSTGANSRACE